jgi:hypothetical protein
MSAPKGRRTTDQGDIHSRKHDSTPRTRRRSGLLWQQVHRPFGAQLTRRFVPRACALGYSYVAPTALEQPSGLPRWNNRQAYGAGTTVRPTALERSAPLRGLNDQIIAFVTLPAPTPFALLSTRHGSGNVRPHV